MTTFPAAVILVRVTAPNSFSTAPPQASPPSAPSPPELAATWLLVNVLLLTARVRGLPSEVHRMAPPKAQPPRPPPDSPPRASFPANELCERLQEVVVPPLSNNSMAPPAPLPPLPPAPPVPPMAWLSVNIQLETMVVVS